MDLYAYFGSCGLGRDFLQQGSSLIEFVDDNKSALLSLVPEHKGVEGFVRRRKDLLVVSPGRRGICNDLFAGRKDVCVDLQVLSPGREEGRNGTTARFEILKGIAGVTGIEGLAALTERLSRNFEPLI